MSFEEITRKENQLKQLIEVTNFLFNKGEDLKCKLDESQDKLDTVAEV